MASFKAWFDSKSPAYLILAPAGAQRVEEVTIEYVEVFTGLLLFEEVDVFDELDVDVRCACGPDVRPRQLQHQPGRCSAL